MRRGKSWSLRGYIGLSRDNSGGFVGTPLGDSCSEPDILPLGEHGRLQTTLLAGLRSCRWPAAAFAGNGSILAACRYQNDPCSLIYYSSTSVTISHDKYAEPGGNPPPSTQRSSGTLACVGLTGSRRHVNVCRGKTWSAIGLLTGWAQQDGALVRLNDGTIAMPFAHKDK